MSERSSFSVKARIKSFKYAFEGLKTLLVEEHNARIHIIAAVAVIVSGFILEINRTEWIALIIVMGLVFICELINTSLEALADFVSPGKHSRIKKVKDLAAGAVLISAFTALAVGLIVFCPKILELCSFD